MNQQNAIVEYVCCFNFYPNTITNDSRGKRPMKTMWEKEEMQVTSIFSFPPVFCLLEIKISVF